MEILYTLLLLSGLFIAAIITVQPSHLKEWNAFKSKYGKTYSNHIEEKSRMEIFLKNKHKINEHNQKFANGSVMYKMGLNEYSDLSGDEFMTQMTTKPQQHNLKEPTLNENGTSDWNDCNHYFIGAPHDHPHHRHHKHHHHRHHHHHHHHHHHPHHHHHHHHHHSHHKHHHHSHHHNNSHHNHHTHQNISIEHLPDSVDWRNEGAVNTLIPNQGHCGSCSIFAGIAAIEGQYFRKTGKLIRLSEQNVIDCSTDCDCGGCFLSYVYKYAMENEINTEDLYPYTYGQDFSCKYKPDSSNVKISGCMRVPRGDENALKAAIATIGPISVSFDSEYRFHQYSSGIYFDPECDSYTFSHSVLIVGYGTSENGEDYWIVRNSWGPDWGEAGCFRIARNRNNHCGIASEAVFPVL